MVGREWWGEVKEFFVNRSTSSFGVGMYNTNSMMNSVVYRFISSAQDSDLIHAT